MQIKPDIFFAGKNTSIQDARKNIFTLVCCNSRMLGPALLEKRDEMAAGSPVVKCHLLPNLESPRGRCDKVQARFGLPCTEIVLGKYVCALQQKHHPLCHGRLYVFPNYIAFACDLPGYSYCMLLKLSEVSRVKKTKTLLIIPNAIEIRMAEGTSYEFTSFLSRNEAYHQIYDLLLIAKGIEAAKAETSKADEAVTRRTKSLGANTAINSMGSSRSRFLVIFTRAA